MSPISFQWAMPPERVRVDLLEAPAFVSKGERLLLLLPKSPADAKGPGSAPDSRQVLDWGTGRLGFIDPDAMVFHHTHVHISLGYDTSQMFGTYPNEDDK